MTDDRRPNVTAPVLESTRAAESRVRDRRAELSRRLFERAVAVMPGGNTRTQLFTAPHPMYAQNAQGARVTLVDGQVLDDFLLNYTAAAVGHRHPAVEAAARDALSRGGAAGLPTEDEVIYAETLCARVPGLERVRFTTSGSEATLHAIRVARAYTGKPAIAKAEGAYHGSHDLTDFNVWRFASGPLTPQSGTRGMPAALEEAIVVFPFNDLSGTEAVLDEHWHKLAAVIMEPFLNAGGVIPATVEYLKGVARWCAAKDVLFILDEVASFRTSFRGAQDDYGVRPDLTCFGKAIGGGFPLGAFGGREDVMAVLDPRRDDAIRHSGTFNAQPVALAAGRAALELLDKDAITRMNALGRRVAEGMRELGTRSSYPITATVYGSIGSIHGGASVPRTAREAADRRVLPEALYWLLFDAGILVAPRGQFSISVATTETQVERFLAALPPALENLRLARGSEEG